MKNIIHIIKESLYSCHDIQKFLSLQKNFLMQYPKEYKVALEEINSELN